MSFYSNHKPEAIGALPPDPHTPEPATQVECTVLAPAGADPFTVVEAPLELEEVVCVEEEPGSGQYFPDEVAADLAALGNVVMPYGKHKGKRLADVPRSYLQWTVTRPYCRHTPLALTIRDYLAATEAK
jgi:hypothetical protein